MLIFCPYLILLGSNFCENCFSKNEGKDKEFIQLNTTPDTGYQWAQGDIIDQSQKVRPFPVGYHKSS